MKFQDFYLYAAIHDVYLDYEKSNRKPRSANWLIYASNRRLLCDAINGHKISDRWHDERILKAWDDFGKNKEKYKLIIAVAKRFDKQCFYANRNRGCCSDIVRIENILAGAPLVVENCVVVCKKHARNR